MWGLENFCQKTKIKAVESIDGTTSTENDPHIVREHLFVISLG